MMYRLIMMMAIYRSNRPDVYGSAVYRSVVYGSVVYGSVI
jgi:hypothetical protein